MVNDFFNRVARVQVHRGASFLLLFWNELMKLSGIDLNPLWGTFPVEWHGFKSIVGQVFYYYFGMN